MPDSISSSLHQIGCSRKDQLGWLSTLLSRRPLLLEGTCAVVGGSDRLQNSRYKAPAVVADRLRSTSPGILHDRSWACVLVQRVGAPIALDKKIGSMHLTKIFQLWEGQVILSRSAIMGLV